MSNPTIHFINASMQFMHDYLIHYTQSTAMHPQSSTASFNATSTNGTQQALNAFIEAQNPTSLALLNQHMSRLFNQVPMQFLTHTMADTWHSMYHLMQTLLNEPTLRETLGNYLNSQMIYQGKSIMGLTQQPDQTYLLDLCSLDHAAILQQGAKFLSSLSFAYDNPYFNRLIAQSHHALSQLYLFGQPDVCAILLPTLVKAAPQTPNNLPVKQSLAPNEPISEKNQIVLTQAQWDTLQLLCTDPLVENQPYLLRLACSQNQMDQLKIPGWAKRLDNPTEAFLTSASIYHEDKNYLTLHNVFTLTPKAKLRNANAHHIDGQTLLDALLYLNPTSITPSVLPFNPDSQRPSPLAVLYDQLMSLRLSCQINAHEPAASGNSQTRKNISL